LLKAYLQINKYFNHIYFFFNENQQFADVYRGAGSRTTGLFISPVILMRETKKKPGTCTGCRITLIDLDKV